MKNTLPMKLRVLPFVYRVLMSKPVRWVGGVLAGAILSISIVILAPLMVLACVGGSAWMMYMSVFDQAGLKRLAERAKARKLRQGDTDDELRDEVSTN